MPTKRTRTNRSMNTSSLIIAQLGFGCGINHIPDAELKALWQEHGQNVTDHWFRKWGEEPFVARIARMERWPKLKARKT